VAAHAARLRIECCVFIPDNLEAGKLLGSAIFNPTILAIAGNYDDVNRLCTQVADRYGWGIRQHQPAVYYAEGAKPTASRSRSSWDGATRVIWSRRSPAARCFRASSKECVNCEK
jgi:threonine synthase